MNNYILIFDFIRTGLCNLGPKALMKYKNMIRKNRGDYKGHCLED